MSRSIKTSLLKEIAKIQPGFSFRGKIEPHENGEFRVLQIKDVGAGGSLLTDDLTRTNEGDGIKPEYLVQKGDVILTTRGANRRAAFVSDQLPKTIFVAQLFSLRNISESLSGEYLAWYLNQKPAHDFFETNASGSYIQNIKINVLMNLPVAVPPLETQKKILEIYRLNLRERKLIDLIQTKRNQVVEKMLIRAIDD